MQGGGDGSRRSFNGSGCLATILVARQFCVQCPGCRKAALRQQPSGHVHRNNLARYGRWRSGDLRCAAGGYSVADGQVGDIGVGVVDA